MNDQSCESCGDNLNYNGNCPSCDLPSDGNYSSDPDYEEESEPEYEEDSEFYESEEDEEDDDDYSGGGIPSPPALSRSYTHGGNTCASCNSPCSVSQKYCLNCP